MCIRDSIYTEDGSKYPDLRDALDKLQLNDASLSFEPESSIALGFGFRCGFLGMLHMEIIQERLEREFDLDLVTTLPSVIYEVTKTDGTVVRVDNPHNYPDPGAILEAREPYAKVSIISPPDYVGNIMPMCQDRRGVFKDMQYLDTNLCLLYTSCPPWTRRRSPPSRGSTSPPVSYTHLHYQVPGPALCGRQPPADAGAAPARLRPRPEGHPG